MFTYSDLRNIDFRTSNLNGAFFTGENELMDTKFTKAQFEACFDLDEF